MGTVMEAQGADTAGARDQVVASNPLAPDEPIEPIRTEPSRSDSEPLLQRCRSTKVCKVKVPQAQASRSLLMRSALPEELVARAEGEDIRDTVFTVPLLRNCIINMIHDMEKNIELPLKSQ